MEQIQGMSHQLDNHLQDQLLKDLEEWVSDCLMYNQSFVDNQELLEKLILAFEDNGSAHPFDDSDNSKRSRNDLNIDEIKRILNRI